MGVDQATQTDELEPGPDTTPEHDNEQNEIIDSGEEKSGLGRLSTGAKVGIGVGVVTGAAGAVMLAPVAIAAMGFGAGGVVGGSLAAWIQSCIGLVQAGSWFAAFQSAGAAGLAASTSVGIGVVGGTVGAAAGGATTALAAKIKNLTISNVDKATQTDAFI